MGFMSRRVLPACANFACFACPGLRARSRKPIKRYKLLLLNIYPKSQTSAINERAIGKLADYAAENPIRIIKIVNKLEKKGVKELKLNHFTSVQAIMKAYSKLLSSCKNHMPLFAMSALSMIYLLVENKKFEMKVLACHTLTDFLINQVDATYAHNLEAMIPKIVFFARETAKEKKKIILNSASLRCLSSLIWYMREFSYFPQNFNDIITVILDNYDVSKFHWTEISKNSNSQFSHSSSFSKNRKNKNILNSNSSLNSNSNHQHQIFVDAKLAFTKIFLNLKKINKEEDEKNEKNKKNKENVYDEISNANKTDLELPEIWVHVCFQGLAKMAASEFLIAKRILDPILEYLDVGNYWKNDSNLNLNLNLNLNSNSNFSFAFCVLCDLQESLENTGSQTLIINFLIRHLENKNVISIINTRILILDLISKLAKTIHSNSNSNLNFSVSDVLSVKNLSIHLSSCLIEMEENEKKENEISSTFDSELHLKLKNCIEECIQILINLAKNILPIINMITVELESLSPFSIISKNTIVSLNIIIIFITQHSNFDYEIKNELPENLFFQIFQCSWHPDPFTRAKCQQTLSILLSYFCKKKEIKNKNSIVNDKDDGVVGFEKEFPEKEISEKDKKEKHVAENDKKSVRDNKEWVQNLRSNFERFSKISFKHSGDLSHNDDEREMIVMESAFDESQLSLILDLIFNQIYLKNNIHENFIGFSKTFSYIVLLIEPEIIHKKIILKVFLLIFSLYRISLGDDDSLSPLQKLSIFTLYLSMLLLLSKKIYFNSNLKLFIDYFIKNDLKNPFLEISENGNLFLTKKENLVSIGAMDYDSFENETPFFNSIRHKITLHSPNNTFVKKIICEIPFVTQVFGNDCINLFSENFVPEDSYFLRPKMFSTLTEKSKSEKRISSIGNELQSLPANENIDCIESDDDDDDDDDDDGDNNNDGDRDHDDVAKPPPSMKTLLSISKNGNNIIPSINEFMQSLESMNVSLRNSMQMNDDINNNYNNNNIINNNNVDIDIDNASISKTSSEPTSLAWSKARKLFEKNEKGYKDEEGEEEDGDEDDDGDDDDDEEVDSYSKKSEKNPLLNEFMVIDREKNSWKMKKNVPFPPISPFDSLLRVAGC